MADKASAIQVLQNPATPAGALVEAVGLITATEICDAKEVTVLLASFARRVLWRSAVTLLWKAKELVDLPCLGAALQACEKSGQWQLALTLLEDFSSQRLVPDGGALASALLACGKDGAWQRGCWILKQMLRPRGSYQWIESEALPMSEWSRVGTAAVSLCGHQWQMATHLLKEMKQKGLRLSAVPFNAWMRYSRCSENEAGSTTRRGRRSEVDAWQIHMQLAEELTESSAADQITLNSLVRSCGTSNAWEMAISVIKVASAWLDVKSDVVSLNTAMSACARAEEWQQSFALFFNAHTLRVTPNVVTFNTAIHAATSEEWQVALELLEMLLESRLQPDLFSFNSALAACRDHWAVCLSLLSAWRQRSPRPDVVSFNSVLAALSSSGEQGDWQHAIGLLETMRSDLVAPDLNSFNRALDACSGARRWEEALCLVQDLRHEHLHCDLHTVTAVASVCGHAGEWQMALAFANDQRSLHVLPDGLLFGSLLLACEKGLQWEIAVQLLEDMHQSTIALDPISSSLAIRACATCNSWALALWVLAHCCDRDPGPRAYLAAVDAVEAGGGASPELFEELCQKAARSSLFS